MKTFEKNYIGKGKQVQGMDIVKIFIPIEKLESAFFEKDGQKFLGLEIAKLKSADKFGRTHTVYYQTIQKKTAKKSTKK